MAFKKEGGFTQPVGMADPKPLHWGAAKERERCERCDRPVAMLADFDDPNHPGGCECDLCRALCWGYNCVEFDWRGECLELRASADLHSRMMKRARDMWMAAHPEVENSWPDGAANVAWLVEEIDRLRTRVRDLEGS